MTKSDPTPSQFTGCMAISWRLFVTTPMWLALLFALCRAAGDALPTWAWVLYWCYVPASVLGVVVAGTAEIISIGEKRA